MPNSTMLDVAFGLIFVVLAVSLSASAATEAVASLLNLRARLLLASVKDLVGDQHFNDLAAELYAHPLVNPLGSSRDLKRNLPAYIEPEQFAKALMELLHLPPLTAGELQAAVNARAPAGSHPKINQLMTGIVIRAGGDQSAIKAELAGWFDNAMDSVSTAYKRRTQLMVFAAALVISLVINAGAAHVAGAGWPRVRGLPFITALASLFGAPFWFDMLRQVVRLKGPGET